jgi:hypothetical protein
MSKNYCISALKPRSIYTFSNGLLHYKIGSKVKKEKNNWEISSSWTVTSYALSRQLYSQKNCTIQL